ncbi:hypothetical protein [Acinetobacter sp. WZC-1]|uniref:hypothetical protein n=1 Tax=Acinetobacter sp. WZC-1 TaxID=3459034 RepID=UPI00403D9201
MMVCCTIGWNAEIPEAYVRGVEKASSQYNTEMRNFLRSLDPKLTRFDSRQQDRFCHIVTQYINDIYRITDQNRGQLPLSYASFSQQDVINQVMASTEMQLLKKYDIQCDFKAIEK